MSLRIDDDHVLELAQKYQQAVNASSMTHAIREALERGLRALNGPPTSGKIRRRRSGA